MRDRAVVEGMSDSDDREVREAEGVRERFLGVTEESLGPVGDPGFLDHPREGRDRLVHARFHGRGAILAKLHGRGASADRGRIPRGRRGFRP